MGGVGRGWPLVLGSTGAFHWPRWERVRVRPAAPFPLPPGRRSSKLVSLITSCFTGSYIRRWPERLPGTPLRSTPLFDGRAVCYPTLKILRDYLAWRQVDTHINNLVRPRVGRLSSRVKEGVLSGSELEQTEVLAWGVRTRHPRPRRVCRAAIHLYYDQIHRSTTPVSGRSSRRGHRRRRRMSDSRWAMWWAFRRANWFKALAGWTWRLSTSYIGTCFQGTLSSHKNEMLFSEFGINYNHVPERFRKVRQGACDLVIAAPLVPQNPLHSRISANLAPEHAGLDPRSATEAHQGRASRRHRGRPRAVGDGGAALRHHRRCVLARQPPSDGGLNPGSLTV